MEIPDEVKWLLPIVVGESWPEGDEDKLRELRDAWTVVAQELPDALDTGNRAAREVLGSWSGEAADKFDQTWSKFSDGGGGQEAVFASLQEGSNGLAEACDKAALDVEYTKYMIIASLIVLAIQIAAMIAAAFVSFGASSAGIVPAQLATRYAVQMIFRQLVQKLMQQGVKKVVREALEKVLKKGLEKLTTKGGLKSLRNQIGINMGAEAAMDAGIQGVQMAKGDRESWDWDKTKDAARGGAVGGVAGHLVSGHAVSNAASDAAAQGASSVAGHAARGAAEGALGAVGEAAVSGNLGDLEGGDVLMGASGGAVDGGTGGAKDGFQDAASARNAAESASSAAGEASSAADSASSGVDSGGAASQASADAPQASSADSGSVPESSGSSDAPPSAVDSAGGGDAGSGDSAAPSATSSAAAAAPERPETAMGSAPGGSGVPAPGAAGQSAGGPQPGGQPGNFGGSAGGMPAAGGAPAGGAPGHAGAAPRGDFGPQGARQGGFGPTGAPQQGGQPLASNQGPQRGFGPGPQGGQPPGPPNGPGPRPQQLPPQQGMQGAPQSPQQGPRPPQHAPPQPYAPGPQQSGPAHHGPQQSAPQHPGPRQPGPPSPPQSGPPQSGPPQSGPQPSTPQQASPAAHAAQPGPSAPQRPPQQGFQQGPPPQQGGPAYPSQGPAQLPPQQGQPPRGPVGPNGAPPRQGPAAQGQRPPQPPEVGNRTPQQTSTPSQGQPLRQTPRPAAPESGPRAPQSFQQGVLPTPQRSSQRPATPAKGAPEPPRRDRARPESQDQNQNGPEETQTQEQPDPQDQPAESTPDQEKPDDEPRTSDENTPGDEPRADESDPAGSDDTPRGDTDSRPESDAEPEVGHTPEVGETDQRATLFDETETRERWDGEKADEALKQGAYIGSEQNLDFCRDPNYRAPDAAFDALDRRLSAIATDRGLDGKPARNQADPVCSRRAMLAERINDRINASPALRSLSKRGAMAAHAYTGHEIFHPLNAAARMGMMSESERHQMQAIASGLNEQPRHVGRVVRGVYLGGDKEAGDVAAAHYEPGKVTVETQFTSCSMQTDEHQGSAVPGDVEMHVDSKTARRLMELASKADEREAVLMPMSQLYVHDKELQTWQEMGQDGELHDRQKWIIHAEEIVSGDPRYLDSDEASQQVTDRQRRTLGEQVLLDSRPKENTLDAMTEYANTGRSGQQHAGDSVAEQLGTSDDGPESPRASSTAEGNAIADALNTPDSLPETASDGPISAEPDGPSAIEERLNGNDDVPTPGEPPPGHADLGQPGHGPVPPLPLNEDGTPDWRQLSGPTPPVTTRQALHGGSAHIAHGDAYVAANHPELPRVNPNFYAKGAWETGWQTNCSKCVVNYAKRMAGIDETVAPVRPEDLPKEDRMAWMADQVGSKWEPFPPSYDSVIDRMDRQPVGSMASVYVAHEVPAPNGHGKPTPIAHVAIVTNTPDGVAFIDPQSGRLMNLPYPPTQLALLPFGSPDTDTVNLGTATHTSDESSSSKAELPREENPVEAEVKSVSDHERQDDSDREADSERDPDGPDQVPELDTELPKSDDRVWRQDGPWFGQHANPFRTVPSEEEEYDLGQVPDERIVPSVQPAGSSSSGQPDVQWPQQDAPGATSPGGSVPGGSTPGQSAMPPNAGSAMAPPSFSSGMNRSFSGDLGTGVGASPPAVEIPDPAATSSARTDGAQFGGGAGSGDQAVPGSAGAAAAGGQPSEAAMRPGGNSGSGSAEQSAGAGSSGGAGGSSGGAGSGAPMGGGMAPAQNGGDGSGREGRSHELGAVTHNRDVTIPADAAALYLGNHEPTTLLPADGRQVLFRADAPFDVGPGAPSDAPESVLQLRYEAADSGTGMAFGDELVRDGEFAGSAEIHLRAMDGSEVLLGSFEAGLWTPTPEGNRWLSGAQDVGNDRGRTR